MPEQNIRREAVFLSVGFRPYDGALQEDSLFARVRRAYFASLNGASGKDDGYEDGARVLTRYKIKKGGFYWRRVSGKRLLQAAYPEGDGYCIAIWNREGEMTAKAVFSGAHRWLRTSYYEGNVKTPCVLIQPGPNGGLLLFRRGNEQEKYRKTTLEPCPYFPGTAKQSFVDAAAGEPQLLAQTEDGFFCYCTPEERAGREALLAKYAAGGAAEQPSWADLAPGDDAPFEFQFVANGGEPEPPEEQREAPAEPERRTERAVRAPRDYAADHELFSVDVPKPMKYSVAAKGSACGTVIGPAVAPGVQRATKRIVVSEKESYLYFGKVIDGLRQGHGRTQMSGGFTAYEGGYLDDKRSGFGVYYYKSGKLCYAGNWKGNRREGLGVAFRSADESVFVGKWKDNIPTGQGTAFDADGNLIYSGEWKNGKRHGFGTEYENGVAVYAGEFRDDRRAVQNGAAGAPD